MALYLDVVDGPEKGKNFLIQVGYTIGRKHGEVLLNDSKVSGRHAQVELDEKEQIVLVDLGSSNGIRLEGNKVPRIDLTHGTEFQLGRYHFKVRNSEDTTSSESVLKKNEESESSGAFSTVDEMSPAIENEMPDPSSWQDVLKNKLKELTEKASNVQKPIQYFDPLIQLVFEEGIQADENLLVGYGPRVAGCSSSDLLLLEPGGPEMAFRLHPLDDHGAEFVNLAASKIKLNGRPVETKKLEEGDVISVGYTKIQVRFVRGDER